MRNHLFFFSLPLEKKMERGKGELDFFFLFFARLETFPSGG